MVNTRWLLPGKLEGMGIYTLRMLQQIIPACPEHLFVLLLDRAVDTEALELDFENAQFHVVPPPARHPLLWTLWNGYMVPRALKKLGADLYWSPDGLPARTEVKQWLTIHDLNFEHHPEWIPAGVAKHYRRNIRRGAELAQHIFTVSEWTKNDLMATYHVRPEDISLTYNAPQKPMQPGKSSFEGPYFCAVGALTPRKNLITLIRAFDQWASAHPETTDTLKIAGVAHFKDTEFDQALAQVQHRNRIQWLGRLSDTMLEELYRGATAYCMPSAMEGFGIPLVEAMQCGTPVIASENSALPEVVGNGGLLVPTYDVDAWCSALEQMRVEREQWVENALARGNSFRWADSASPFIEKLRS